MGGKVGQPKRFQRDIEDHRSLYEGKELRRIKDNLVFYWRFLAHLEDIGYRPRTVQAYHERLRKFLRWLGDRSLRKVRRADIKAYLLYHKSERQRVAYTIRYERQALAMFFGWLMGFCRMKVNPATGLGIRMYYNQPEKMDLFSREETATIVAAPLRALERVRRVDFPTDLQWRAEIYRLKMHHVSVKLLFSTGMRPCELVGLETKDFDREQLRLRVATRVTSNTSRPTATYFSPRARPSGLRSFWHCRWLCGAQTPGAACSSTISEETRWESIMPTWWSSCGLPPAASPAVFTPTWPGTHTAHDWWRTGRTSTA